MRRNYNYNYGRRSSYFADVAEEARRKLKEYERQLVAKYRPADAEKFTYADLWQVATEEEHNEWLRLDDEFGEHAHHLYD